MRNAESGNSAELSNRHSWVQTQVTALDPKQRTRVACKGRTRVVRATQPTLRVKHWAITGSRSGIATDDQDFLSPGGWMCGYFTTRSDAFERDAYIAGTMQEYLLVARDSRAHEHSFPASESPSSRFYRLEVLHLDMECTMQAGPGRSLNHPITQSPNHSITPPQESFQSRPGC